MKYPTLEYNKKKHNLLDEFVDLWDKSNSIEEFAVNAALQARFPMKWILGARWYYFKKNCISGIWTLVTSSVFLLWIPISLIHGHWFCPSVIALTALVYIVLWFSVMFFFRDTDKALQRART